MHADQNFNKQALAAFVVICLAVVGFFTGLQSPMKSLETAPSLIVDGVDSHVDRSTHESNGHNSSREPGVQPATHYNQMPELTKSLRSQVSLSQTFLASLQSSVDPMAEIKIAPAEKQSALHRRDQNRAYNGAPPTIPHPVDQLSDTSCVACHGVGIKTKSLRIPRMSHQFLTNCTQCHVENNPQHQEPVVFRENEFDGVDAPQEGPRAFPGAPPQIPHPTWMRVDCMSCHGDAGLHGIRTTHPWRTNCQQCHTPAAAMDQTFQGVQSRFLPGPIVED